MVYYSEFTSVFYNKKNIYKKIGGIWCTIVVDESKFSKIKFKVGRFTITLVKDEVDTVTCNLYSVNFFLDNRYTKKIRTNGVCWAGYNNNNWFLCELSEFAKLGFHHLTVNHSYNFVDPIKVANLQKN